MKSRLSTDEVAKKLGLWRPNLQRLIRNDGIPAPPIERVGRIQVRLWSEKDVEAARKALRHRRKQRTS
jgi:excisionase family DNA binding protein